MGLALTIARRSLGQRPGRTVFSMLGIAMGIATVVAVVVLDHNTIIGLSAPHLREGAPDIDLRAPAGVTELGEIEGVSLAARYFQSDGMVYATRSNDKRVKRRVTLVAIDAHLAPELGVYRLADGDSLPVSADAGGVLIGARLAEELELEVGDLLQVSRPPRPGRKRCEDGQLVTTEGPADDPLVRELSISGVLTREKLGRKGAGMVVVVDFPVGEELYRDVHIDRRWWARRDTGVDVERLKSTLARTHSFDLNRAAVLGQAADERAFRTGVNMAGLLAMLLGLYVIFHTLSMSLTERIGEVGTLHALGAARSQVARIFVLEAVLLAGGGALLGMLGGLALARALLALGITTLGVGKHIEVFFVPWGVVGSLAGLGFLIALVGSVYPLVALGNAIGVQALRGERALPAGRIKLGFNLLYAALLALVLPGLYFVLVPIIGEASRDLIQVLLGAISFLAITVLLSMVLPTLLSRMCAGVAQPLGAVWPLSGQLAARAITQGPARIGASAACLALVTAGLVGLKGMTRSLQGEVRVWAEEAVVDKVWARNMPPTEFSALRDHLHQYPGVLGLEKGNVRVHAPFLIMGADVGELQGFGPCASDRSIGQALREEQGMILSRRLALDLDYRVGDPVRLARANGVVEEFRVVLISDTYGHYPYPDERMYGLISDHLMESFYCVDSKTVTEVAVRLERGTDPGVVEAAVLDFHQGPHDMNFRRGEQVERDHLWDIQRDFVLFDVLILLTACLAGLGLLNGQLLAALERTKETGVLKALGASRGQIGGMIAIEALAVGAVGGAMGAILGSLCTPLAVSSLERLAGLELPRTGAGPWIGYGFAGAIFVALLSSLYPLWRTNHADAVRAVRTG